MWWTKHFRLGGLEYAFAKLATWWRLPSTKPDVLKPTDAFSYTNGGKSWFPNKITSATRLRAKLPVFCSKLKKNEPMASIGSKQMVLASEMGRWPRWIYVSLMTSFWKPRQKQKVWWWQIIWRFVWRKLVWSWTPQKRRDWQRKRGLRPIARAQQHYLEVVGRNHAHKWAGCILSAASATSHIKDVQHQAQTVSNMFV